MIFSRKSRDNPSTAYFSPRKIQTDAIPYKVNVLFFGHKVFNLSFENRAETATPSAPRPGRTGRAKIGYKSKRIRRSRAGYVKNHMRPRSPPRGRFGNEKTDAALFSFLDLENGCFDGAGDRRDEHDRFDGRFFRFEDGGDLFGGQIF